MRWMRKKPDRMAIRFACYTQYLGYLILFMDTLDEMYGEGAKDHFIKAFDAMMVEVYAQKVMNGDSTEEISETVTVHKAFLSSLQASVADSAEPAKALLSLFSDPR